MKQRRVKCLPMPIYSISRHNNNNNNDHNNNNSANVDSDNTSANSHRRPSDSWQFSARSLARLSLLLDSNKRAADDDDEEYDEIKVN